MNTNTTVRRFMLVPLTLLTLATPRAANAEASSRVAVRIDDSLGRTVIATSPSVLPGVMETQVCHTPCVLQVEPGPLALTDDHHAAFGTVGVPDHDIAIELPEPGWRPPTTSLATPPQPYLPGAVLVTFGIATMGAGAQITVSLAIQAAYSATQLPAMHISFAVTPVQTAAPWGS